MTETPEPRTHHSDEHTLLFVAGLGPATTCAAYAHHRPRPMRFVWHHILPQVCGGKTKAMNLVQLCDSCHYSVHALMTELVLVNGDPHKIAHLGTASQRALALTGYDEAAAAGTTDRIPNEGGSAVGEALS